MSRFITFEGPEGAGKTTQIQRLAEALRARDYPVVTTREPGGTAIGEAIRAVLLAPEHCAMLPETEALLMTAARAQHVAEVIGPALAQGQVVICDRFVDSTLAYQGAGRGLDAAGLLAMQDFAVGALRPDLTILLDVPVELGLARRARSGEPLSRIDADARTFHERVRAWFLAAAERDPARWRIIDAAGSEEDVARVVQSVVLGRLASSAGGGCQ